MFVCDGGKVHSKLCLIFKSPFLGIIQIHDLCLKIQNIVSMKT